MEEVKVGLRLFIYATYNSESFGSPPGIQLIFAKLSLTEELTFTKAGTTRGLEEGKKYKKERKRERERERMLVETKDTGDVYTRPVLVVRKVRGESAQCVRCSWNIYVHIVVMYVFFLQQHTSQCIIQVGIKYW